MKIQGKIWPTLLVLVMMSFSLTAYPQKRQPDVHFEPTPRSVVEAMLKMAGVTRDDIVYDLGCGDGRFVIMAAEKSGARAVGVDIDPVRVRECNRNARRKGVTDRVKFIQADLFQTDIHEASVVTLYLLQSLNLRLRPKLLSELKPGSRIVSYTFDMGDWKPDKRDSVSGVYFYCWIVPADIAGRWRWGLGPARRQPPNELLLEQNFQEFSGKANVEGGRVQIREPRLLGDQLAFSLKYSSGGQSVTVQLNGRVSGDTIRGIAEVQGGPSAGTREWSASRVREAGRPFRWVVTDKMTEDRDRVSDTRF
jgi:SAM-dependent methyltransferase